MQIRIEREIAPSDLGYINRIISIVNDTDFYISLEDLIEVIRDEVKSSSLKIGKGSSHIWVSNWRSDRILLIQK